MNKRRLDEKESQLGLPTDPRMDPRNGTCETDAVASYALEVIEESVIPLYSCLERYWPIVGDLTKPDLIANRRFWRRTLNIG